MFQHPFIDKWPQALIQIGFLLIDSIVGKRVKNSSGNIAFYVASALVMLYAPTDFTGIAWNRCWPNNISFHNKIFFFWPQTTLKPVPLPAELLFVACVRPSIYSLAHEGRI